MLLKFAQEVKPDRQVLIMEALDHHLSRCDGLVSRAYFRSDDGHWIEHLAWETQADLEASVRLEDDPVVAELFRCFDTRSVSYLRGERINLGV